MRAVSTNAMFSTLVLLQGAWTERRLSQQMSCRPQTKHGRVNFQTLCEVAYSRSARRAAGGYGRHAMLLLRSLSGTAATKKGVIEEGTDTGMAEVMKWLYNDGRSSVLGDQDVQPPEDNMSLGSLQARPTVTLDLVRTLTMTTGAWASAMWPLSSLWLQSGA